MIRATSLVKIFGDRVAEAERLLRAGATREDVAARTGCTVAVHDVTFTVEPGELFVVMGLSGSGKSTLVRLLNRLIEPTSGRVEIDGRDVSALGERDLRDLRNRRLSMVFQHFALLPHRTVRQNVGYGLHLRGIGDRAARAACDEALATVGLADRGDAYPHELSGGMKQRVGIARALATEADLLLMDEPFSALDPLIRREMQELLLRLQRDLGRTIVFITHDLNEAMRIGDRIMIMRGGEAVQVGSGPDILARPASDYVVDFIADVDRTRVLTASDMLREPRLTCRRDDAPAEVLRRLERAEANGVYVLDDDGRIVGAAHDDLLAAAAARGQEVLDDTCHTDEYVAMPPSAVLSELAPLVGRHLVPLAIVDEDRRLLGVVPRAALLGALAAPVKEVVGAQD